jgi:magnesium transporter
VLVSICGDIAKRRVPEIVFKEAFVGLMNGAIVGVVAAVIMYLYASATSPDVNALALSFVVWLAMTASCVASAVSGTLVPLVLKQLGADPATASSILLTTATDVVSMGMLLGLASVLIL